MTFLSGFVWKTHSLSLWDGESDFSVEPVQAPPGSSVGYSLLGLCGMRGGSDCSVLNARCLPLVSGTFCLVLMLRRVLYEKRLGVWFVRAMAGSCRAGSVGMMNATRLVAASICGCV